MTLITRLFPSFDSALALNEKRLTRELGLVAHARANGAQNHPSTDREEPTEIEVKILTRGQHAIDETAQWLRRRIALHTKAVRELLPTPAERDPEAKVDEAEFELVRLRDDSRDNLTALAQADAAALRELRKFRADNRLTRNAYYLPTILAAGLSTIALVGESLLNARIFAEVSPLGTFGGWVTAFLYSVINFVLGFVVTGAIGLRYTMHVRWSRRILGLIVTLWGAAAIVGYNAYLGTHRAALEADPGGESLGRTLATLVADPAGFLNSPEAFQLFVTGLVFALIFTIKGYAAFDPYPGHKRVHKQHVDARKALETGKVRFRRAAKACVDRHVAAIEKALTAIELRHKTVLDRINEAEIDATVAQTAAVDSAAVCQRLIATWRTENAAIRTTPAPAYFSVLPSLDGQLRGLPKTDFARHRAEREADISTLRAAAKAAQARLREMATSSLATNAAEIAQAEYEGNRRDEDEARPDRHAHDERTLHVFPKAAE